MSTSQQFQYFYTVFWLTCLVVFWQYSPWTSVFSKGKGVLFLFLHQNIIEFFIKKRIYYTCKKLDRQRQTGSLVLVNHPTNHIYCSLETLNHEVQQVTLRPPTVPPPSLSKCYKFMRMLKNNVRWAQINFSPSADARTRARVSAPYTPCTHWYHVHWCTKALSVQSQTGDGLFSKKTYKAVNTQKHSPHLGCPGPSPYVHLYLAHSWWRHAACPHCGTESHRIQSISVTDANLSASDGNHYHY